MSRIQSSRLNCEPCYSPNQSQHNTGVKQERKIPLQNMYLLYKPEEARWLKGYILSFLYIYTHIYLVLL